MADRTVAAEPVRSVSYRHDLDGLRGVAIAFVVIFHVFVGRVSGGVDVFLLLSGYFFLGSQLRYASRDTASANPWWPVWRTIRRLFPALLLVLGVTALVVFQWVPWMRSMEMVSQFTASALYYQNWELASQAADYNVASGTVSPLQHLWSMAVQGQFYLMAVALGMLVIWLRRAGLDLRRWVGPFLVVVTVASFVYATWLHQEWQPLNYYSTFSRMWQLTAGGVLALYGHRLRLPAWLKGLAGFVGLLMVLSTGLLFDGAELFPGPAALYPIGGAVLVILSGGYGPVSRALVHPVMRWLGDIAYPLYLWHWPLLILGLILLDLEEVDWALGLGVIAVSLVLADVTHRFVEKPLRQRSRRPIRDATPARDALAGLRTSLAARARAVGGAAVGLVLAGLLTLQGVWEYRLYTATELLLDATSYPGVAALYGAPVPDVRARPEPELVGSIFSRIWTEGCISRFGDDPTLLHVDDRGEHCIFGDPEATRDVYLVGGSHAEQFVIPLDILGREHGFRVIPLVRQSCPTYVEERDGLFEEDCTIYNQQVVQRLTEADPELVVSTTTRPFREWGSLEETVPASYHSFWEFLAEEDIPFVGLRDNPWHVLPDGTDHFIPACVQQELKGGDLDACGIREEDFYAPTDPAAAWLDLLPLARAVDTSTWYCEDGFCPAVIGNIIVYRDGNHLSLAYAKTLAPLLWEEIRDYL